LGHRAAQERLAGVGDFGVRKRRDVRPAPVPDVSLVKDEGRRAVRGRQRAQAQAADRDLAVGLRTCCMRPEGRGQTAYLLRTRRNVTALT
jgi:hypothetical protein